MAEIKKCDNCRKMKPWAIGMSDETGSYTYCSECATKLRNKKREMVFQLSKKGIIKELSITTSCPFCGNLEPGNLCEKCGAKVVYYDGGCYCPMCESTHYYSKQEIDLPKI